VATEAGIAVARQVNNQLAVMDARESKHQWRRTAVLGLANQHQVETWSEQK